MTDDALTKLQRAIDARTAAKMQDPLTRHQEGLRLVRNFLHRARDSGIYKPLDDVFVADITEAIGDEFAKVTGSDKNIEGRISQIMKGILMKAEKGCYYFPLPKEDDEEFDVDEFVDTIAPHKGADDE